MKRFLVYIFIPASTGWIMGDLLLRATNSPFATLMIGGSLSFMLGFFAMPPLARFLMGENDV